MMTPEQESEFKDLSKVVLKRLEDAFAKMSKEDVKNIHDTMEMAETLSPEGLKNLPPDAVGKIQRAVLFLYYASMLQKLFHVLGQGLFISVTKDHTLQFIIHGFGPTEKPSSVSYLWTTAKKDLEAILPGPDLDFLENALKKFSPDEPKEGG